MQLLRRDVAKARVAEIDHEVRRRLAEALEQPGVVVLELEAAARERFERRPHRPVGREILVVVTVVALGQIGQAWDRR